MKTTQPDLSFRAFWIKRTFYWAVAGEALLLGYRLAFALLFGPEASRTPGADIARGLLEGLRFDLATLPLLIGGIVLLEPLVFIRGPGRRERLHGILVRLQFIYMGLLALLLAAGLIQYHFNQKFLGPEFFVYFRNGPGLAAGLLREDLGLIGLVLLPACPAGLWIAVFRRTGRQPPPGPDLSWGSGRRLPYLSLPAIALLLVIMLRGGFQAAPLRPADALAGTSSFESHLPLNTIFTVYHGGRESNDFPEFFAKQANADFVRRLYELPTANKDYPLLRELPGETHPALRGPSGDSIFRPHVVVVFLESVSVALTRERHHGRELTPRLNALRKDAVDFQRFYASGGRSTNALFSLLSGIPDRAGRTILRSPGMQNRIRGLPGILGDVGYRSFFLHARELRFDSLDRVLPVLGFDTVADREAIPRSDHGPDAAMFANALERMDRRTAEGPVFAMLYTVGSHHPYDQGPTADRLLTGDDSGQRLRNAVNRLDYNTGNFLEAARRRVWFRDTIFVLVADHSHHAGLTFLEDLHLPLLIFAPRLLSPRRSERIGTHLDLHETLLGLAGGGTRTVAMGRDLFAEHDPVGGAFFAGGSRTDVIGWVDADRLCLVWSGLERTGAPAKTRGRLGLPAGRAALYSSRYPVDAFQRNFVEPRRLTDCADRARHVYQFARDLERANRFWPEAD